MQMILPTRYSLTTLKITHLLIFRRPQKIFNFWKFIKVFSYYVVQQHSLLPLFILLPVLLYATLHVQFHTAFTIHHDPSLLCRIISSSTFGAVHPSGLIIYEPRDRETERPRGHMYKITKNKR